MRKPELLRSNRIPLLQNFGTDCSALPRTKEEARRSSMAQHHVEVLVSREKFFNNIQYRGLARRLPSKTLRRHGRPMFGYCHGLEKVRSLPLPWKPAPT